MKIRSSLAAVAVVFWTAAAAAQNNYSFTNVVNQTVPDGNQSGLTLAANVGGVSGPISDISLSLNVGSASGSTAYNGDLYAYLAGPNGGFSVLLDRVGVGTGNTFGYGDHGIDVTFSLGALSNIHFYQQGGTYSLNGAGQLTGTWGADGRTTDPQSAPAAFDSGGTAGLESFLGANPNGTWVLFVADVSGGNTAEVNTWTLNLQTVPEPSMWALMLAAGVVSIKFRGGFRRNG
jgi:subtilisin-like proprotein convertase family protein